MQKKIGFIGSGNMAEAIIGALVRKGLFLPEAVYAADKSRKQLEKLESSMGIDISAGNAEIFEKCEITVLSVKPQNMKEVLEEIKPSEKTSRHSKRIVISIAAGLSLEFIEKIFYSQIDESSRIFFPVSRVMPNTPALVGAGMSGICFNRYISDDDAESVKEICGAMGRIFVCDEREMDAVTAMSGSGPAYVFYFMEAVMAAGKELGFSDEISSMLTQETFAGALKLLAGMGETPEVLRRKVTSPGGTTEAAVRHMEKAGLKDEIIRAVCAASDRSKELGEILKKL